jgi:broad specificity phosphatase PhoE
MLRPLTPVRIAAPPVVDRSLEARHARWRSAVSRSAFLALVVAALAGSATAFRSPTDPATVVLLVRHAEKASPDAPDPELSASGSERARELVNVARMAGVNTIITTQLVRTRQTAEPAAKALGVTPEVIATSAVAAHAKAVADAILQRHRGQTILVVGHSNTVPAIVGALGAAQLADICDSEYDNLFVVVLSDGGAPRLVRSRYGTPSPVGQGCPTMKPQ